MRSPFLSLEVEVSVNTGGEMMIRTGPGLIMRLFFLMMLPVPMRVKGTIGALARTANKWPPFLNGPMVPSCDRVPSGKITTE